MSNEKIKPSRERTDFYGYYGHTDTFGDLPVPIIDWVRPLVGVIREGFISLTSIFRRTSYSEERRKNGFRKR